MRRLLLLALAGLVLAACGPSSTGSGSGAPTPSPTPQTCAGIYALLQLRPSETADSDAHGQCIPQNLQISGELGGAVQVAHLQSRPEASCFAGVLGAPFHDIPTWEVVVAGKLYTLRLRPTVTYRGEASTVQSDLTGAVELEAADLDYRAKGGQLTVDASGYRGNVDADLARDAVGASPVHIKGDWSCGTLPASPSSNASVPCSSYFAAGGNPPGVDPSTLPCLGQDLTFTGGLAAHVTEAVILPPPGSGAPSTCGGLLSNDRQNYGASESFAVAGRRYDLAFASRQDPVQGPLEFPAGPSYQTASGDTKSTLVLGTGAVTWSSKSGTFTLAADRKSGTVDMDLVGGLSGSESVHVSGSWRCGK